MVTTDWFKVKDVIFMDWPWPSPDLNAIENLWGILFRRVFANVKQFIAVEELGVCVVAEWTIIDRATCYNLVKSMTRGFATVLEIQRMKTNY